MENLNLLGLVKMSPVGKVLLLLLLQGQDMLVGALYA
jgi:hypothetical protein